MNFLSVRGTVPDEFEDGLLNFFDALATGVEIDGVRSLHQGRLGTAGISLVTFGHLARGAVFGIVGIFLIRAALDYNPSKAVGLDGALAKLANHSYGSWLLGVVAAGLVSFAIYSLSDARYRRI